LCNVKCVMCNVIVQNVILRRGKEDFYIFYHKGDIFQFVSLFVTIF